jgi:hypothetical protein
MARLIPETILDQSSPRCERKLLVEFARESSISENWVVLHSLKLCRHVTRMQGEADFLVMMPGVGFLVVEVKGCGVSRQDGLWVYEYSEPRRSSVGPFRQAEDAWRSLKDWLATNGFRNEMRRMLFHSCVVFTEIDFEHNSTEWTDAEIVNQSDLASHGIVECLRARMQLRHGFVSMEKKKKPDSYGWYDYKESRPDITLVEQISERLRGDFSIRPDTQSMLRRQLQALDKVIENSTMQQATIARGAFRNPRVLVSGAAGTGKTFLATRLAREWATDGLRVGLFCFNRLLGQSLRQEFSGSTNGRPDFVGTFDSFLLRMLEESPPENAPSAYWSSLRGRSIEALMNASESELFDVLVLDEAQDLMNPECLDFLDLALKGGLAKGRWAFFGDFSRQAIYSGGASENELLSRLSKYVADHFSFPLTTNCRNASRIASSISVLGGLDPAYDAVMNQSLMGEVQPHFCAGEDEKCNRLRNLINEQSGKYGRQNVVVLSSKRKGLLYRALRGEKPQGFSPLRILSEGEEVVRFGTIHAYKGLEAKSVIITDCDWNDAVESDLFYIALSRAEVEAHIILDESQRQAYLHRALS